MNAVMRLYMLVSEIDGDYYPVRDTVYKTLEGAEKGREAYLKDGSKIPVYIVMTDRWLTVEEGADE